jgi:hypothetical protein
MPEPPVPGGRGIPLMPKEKIVPFSSADKGNLIGFLILIAATIGTTSTDGIKIIFRQRFMHDVM